MYKIGELVKVYLFNSNDKVIFKKNNNNFSYGIILEINKHPVSNNSIVYKVSVDNQIFYTIEAYLEKV